MNLLLQFTRTLVFIKNFHQYPIHVKILNVTIKYYLRPNILKLFFPTLDSRSATQNITDSVFKYFIKSFCVFSI